MKRRPSIGKLALFAVASAFTVIPALSQSSLPAKKPSFEVVSVKPIGPGIVGGGPSERGDRYTYPLATLSRLLGSAYGGLRDYQIIGGPSWMNSDRFEIQAKADCSGGPITQKQLRLMIQSLLEDRFQLKAHMETRELPIYELVVAKDGLKMQLSEDQTPTPASLAFVNRDNIPPQLCVPPKDDSPRTPPVPPDLGKPPVRGGGRIIGGNGAKTIEFSAASIPMLINYLQTDAGRPIVDKTELKGLYDYKLQFSTAITATPLAAAPVAGATDPIPFPPLTTALQQQLGLRLEAKKGPVDVLVIDSIQNRARTDDDGLRRIYWHLATCN